MISVLRCFGAIQTLITRTLTTIDARLIISAYIDTIALTICPNLKNADKKFTNRDSFSNLCLT